MVESQPSKLVAWVRFPSPAPNDLVFRRGHFFVSFCGFLHKILVYAPIHYIIGKKFGDFKMLNDLFSLLSLDKTIAKELFEKYDYPHQILPELGDFIRLLGSQLPKDGFHYSGNCIWISKTASVAPSACLSGPLIVDHGAEIRHCAFIRGSVIIGKNAVVGNSTELKNCVLFDNVQVPHYNYVGDSVLGYKAHLGASAITSNVKSDKSTVFIGYGKEKFCSGLHKLGAIVGDLAEIGCGSVLNPGTVIGSNTTVYPLSSVRGFVRENSIYKNKCASETVAKKTE